MLPWGALALSTPLSSLPLSLGSFTFLEGNFLQEVHSCGRMEHGPCLSPLDSDSRKFKVLIVLPSVALVNWCAPSASWLTGPGQAMPQTRDAV